MDLFGIKARRAKREARQKQEKEHEEELDLKKRFREAFDFYLSQLPDAISWEQLVVDKRLKELAERFRDSCSRQEKVMEIPEENRDPVEEYHKKLLEAAINIEAAKKAFWNAHKIAKEVGFSVKERYTDYIPALSRVKVLDDQTSGTSRVKVLDEKPGTPHVKVLNDEKGPGQPLPPTLH